MKSRAKEIMAYARANPGCSHADIIRATGACRKYVTRIVGPPGRMSDKIVQYAKAHPNATNCEVAKALDASPHYVSRVRCIAGLSWRYSKRAPLRLDKPNTLWATAEADKIGCTLSDFVNSVITDARLDDDS